MSRAGLRDLLEAIPALLFPERCGACEALCDGPFCAPCSETLLPVPAGCPLCGEPGDEALLPALRPRRCGRCRKDPPPYARAQAPFLHGGALSEAIHRLKYEGREELARPLGALFAGCDPPRADVVSPIPLHASRLRERGYDQAALLAREAGRRSARCAAPQAFAPAWSTTCSRPARRLRRRPARCSSPARSAWKCGRLRARHSG